MAKKLLNEATIRRFQSLANISPINEMSYKRDEKEEMEEVKQGDEDKEKMEEAVYEVEDEKKMEEGAYMEKDENPADDEGMDDMGGMEGMDVDLTDEEARVLIELGEKLAAAMGEGDEPEEMGDEPMDDAPMMEEDELMETLSEIDYVPSQTEVVNEVARRVARRLAEAQKAEKRMNEALGRK